ncbi:sigma factor [Streptomyces sp. DSM 3412]|uniref:Sigma factor n=1 Tax=Streptomyces gottesmaniae TaxID=3075518 RepID=A0ABU2YX31_9ACTN|nr:sigma factor [Streptomyces sp. DSM 3412]MDT0568887.1 sigma factor [Streptomyces sp. DSM 3412]
MADLAMPAARRGTPAEQLSERFTAAYSQYLPMVRATIRGRLTASDAHLVDDLAQNTFLAFYSYLSRLDATRDFGGLLRVMARQSISHHFRVMRHTHERPVDVGSWQYADREMGGTGAGYYIPASTGFRTAAITPRPGDSDPDMDEALRRARQTGGAR